MDSDAKPPLRREAARKSLQLSSRQLESSSSEDDMGDMRPIKEKRTRGLSEVAQGSKPTSRRTPASIRNTGFVAHSKHPSTSSLLPPPSQSARRPKRPQPKRPLRPPAPYPDGNLSPLSESDSEIEMISRPRRHSPPSTHEPPATPMYTPFPVGNQAPVFKKRTISASNWSPAGSLSSLSPLTSPERDDHRSPSPVIEGWSLNTLGRLVWVRIDRFGRLYDGHKHAMWWPAQVVQDLPLRVSLFGKPPPFRDDDATVHIDIQHPSQANVRSMMMGDNVMRFDERNYGGVPLQTRRALFSPKKRQNTGEAYCHELWQDARKLMLKADAMDNDGLPRFLSYLDEEALYRTSDEEDVLSVVAVDEGPWSPPLPNPLLDIPGEPILAREKTAATQHWPAKVMEYIPPKSRRQKPRYKAYFFDGTVKNLTEDMFFTETQPGFGTCKLGECVGNYGLDEEERDINGNFTSTLPHAQDDEETLRAHTPPPQMPPPPHFYTLSMQDQFEYIKPVLAAILQNRYCPVRSRHEAFMGSSASRQKVLNSNHESGDLNAREVEELNFMIRTWVRKRQIRQDRGFVLPDTLAEPPDDKQEVCYPPAPPSVLDSEMEIPPATDAISDIDSSTGHLSDCEPPPPSFAPTAAHEDAIDVSSDSELVPTQPASVCDDDGHELTTLRAGGTAEVDKGSRFGSQQSSKYFSSLSELDQLTYSSCILLQEAKYQILLWRHGLRTSLELLTPEEEEDLHRQAEGKAREINWVHAIIMSRRAMERKMLPTYQEEPKSLPRFRKTRS